MSIVQKTERVCDGCGDPIAHDHGITISGDFEVSVCGHELDACGEHLGCYQRDYCNTPCFERHIQDLDTARLKREALQKKSREGKPYPASVRI